MKKSMTYKIGTLVIGLTAMLFTSCLSDGDDTMVLEKGEKNEFVDGDQTVVVGTNEYADIENGGFTLYVPKGSVPKTNSGDNGRVAFSISHVDIPDLPCQLPAGASVVGKNSIKIEPMNFTFNSPLVLKCPTEGNTNCVLLRYNDYTNSWEVVPFSSRNADGTSNVSLIETGYFVLVEYPQQTTEMGGVRILQKYIDNEYFYYLTLTPVNGSSKDAKMIAFSPNGSPLYMAYVARGEYKAVLSRQKRSQLNSATEMEQYSSVIRVKVTDKLIAGTGGYDTYTGWTDIKLDNISWSDGRSDAWGTITTTYGTGKFQATLTWVNPSEAEHTDYDLHLYGPENLHVYYTNKKQGCFELDRDWISNPGNAVENIYSVSDNFTPGRYQVKVHHYNGVVGKRYNSRVIINGVVVKSVSGAIATNKQYDDIYSFNIE